MKFIIGTASSNTEFEEDIRLIKSSLLYADEIELIGMAEYAVLNYLPKCLTNGNNFEEIFSNLMNLLKAFDSEKTHQVVSDFENVYNRLLPYLPLLKKKKRRDRHEIIAQMKVREAEEQLKAQLMNSCNELMDNPGVKFLQSLVDRNIVSIYDYSYNGFSIDELTGGYFANLIGCIKHSGSYPLFDSICANVVSSIVNNEFLDFSMMDKEIIRHAGVANNILSTLPTLESASVDEILSFKKDMQVPLCNFRKAIYDFSEKISSMPWDDDFQYECVKLYDTEVMPRVNELNELSSETSVLKNFGSKVLNDEEERRKLGYVGAGLITTITTSSGMLDALNLFEIILKAGAKIGLTAAGITAFLKTADVLRQSRKEIQGKKDEIKGNTMYYYYKASQKI